MKSNFDFLNRYWPALAQIGATAETYVYSDPNACIYKLGMFAERLVQEILVFEHIAEPAVDNTHANRIRILKRAGLLPHEIDNTLYVLRKTRNSAVHIGTDSVDWRRRCRCWRKSCTALPRPTRCSPRSRRAPAPPCASCATTPIKPLCAGSIPAARAPAMPAASSPPRRTECAARNKL